MWLSGLIRGSIRHPVKFGAPWLNIREFFDFVCEKRPNLDLGVRGLLSIAKADNKLPFQFKGRFDDPRCQHIGQRLYRLWASAGHGHQRVEVYVGPLYWES